MSKNKPNLEVATCIKILQELVADTNQLFELPEAQRIALYKLAGELSRPNRDEFQRRRKDAKKAIKDGAKEVVEEGSKIVKDAVKEIK